MRRYSDPVQVRSARVEEPVEEPVQPPSSGASSVASSVALAAVSERAEPVVSPQAFIWQGRLYVVRRVLDHWRERRSWWRDALDPVPGRPTGIDVASREQHIWRVEASRGLAYGTGVFDLSSDGAPGDEADWRLVGVSD
jgi:hypothetical protein